MVRPGIDSAVPDIAVPVKQGPPVACLGCWCQVSLAEGLDAIVRDSRRGLSVVHEELDLLGEVTEVSLHFNVVLAGPAGHEEIVVVLNVLQFMGNDD